MRIYELSDGMMIDLESVQVIEPVISNGVGHGSFGIVLSCSKRLTINTQKNPRENFVEAWVNFKNRQDKQTE